ncbi:MAG TPA: hypothetical protein VK208_18725 [Pyrinomonadaceae bacterium]|nr:hypothetical protein [Pyrinomonadaceae bacterium]
MKLDRTKSSRVTLVSTYTRKIVPVVALLMICGIAAMGQAIVTKSIQVTGTEADVFTGCNADGFCVEFFTVAQTPTGVALSYFIATPQGLVSGDGTVPNPSLVTIGKQVILKVDTNTVAGFDNETCVFTEDQGLVCTPTDGSGVTLNFTWTKVPGSTLASTGTQTLSGKGFTFVFHGTRISTSATFAGSLSVFGLSTTFGSADVISASIASSKDLSITITR